MIDHRVRREAKPPRRGPQSAKRSLPEGDHRLQWERLIVALDLHSEREITRAVKTLAPKRVKFKIGSIAFTKFGPELVRKFTRKDIDIFVDLKLHDIPNTMKETARIIAEMKCWAFTVHTKAGIKALMAVRDEVRQVAFSKKTRKPIILGVTELTSSKASEKDVLKLVWPRIMNNMKL